MYGSSYRDLVVWQKAMAFVKDVYRATQTFPKEETYGLRAQIRRAAVSIPSNIAEGQGRLFDREFALFISHALGSLMEVETQILIAGDLGYLSQDAVNDLLGKSAEIGRLANGLMASLKKSASAGPPT
ncbi:MAG: four helix bundle protein [Terriglobales bacterium]